MNKNIWLKKIFEILGNTPVLGKLVNEKTPKLLNQVEKEWIEEQALKMSREIGTKITTSAWMRMTLLKDMEK